MIATQSLQAAHYRLARHYMTRLCALSASYEHGHHHISSALASLDTDWPHLRQWQAWSAQWTNADLERARLCVEYVVSNFAILRLRLSPQDLLAWLHRSLNAAQEIEDRRAERELLHLICLGYLEIESLDESQQYATQLLEQSHTARDRLGQARAWLHLGSTNIHRGRYDQAEEELQRGLRLLQGMDAELDKARLYNHLGRIAVFRGDYPKARDLHLKYIRIFSDLGNLLGKGGGLFSLSGICLFLGDRQAAADYARQSVEIYHALGKPNLLMGSLIALGHAEKALGDYETACQHYAEGINALRAGGAPSTLINGLYGWAQAQVMMGNVQRAMELYTEALQCAVDAKLPFRICEVAADMVLAECIRKDEISAAGYLKECVIQAQFMKTARYSLTAVGAAVVFGAAFGSVEQAALWAGTLRDRPEYVEKLGIFNRTCQQLERELGAERFTMLLQQGKSLSLQSVLESIIQQVGTP
jgi:tetratricopeptide (TPR) repeat protein